MQVLPPGKLDDLCWLVPLGVVSSLSLWAYLSWFRRASERAIFRWAGENGLKLLWLERTRVSWRDRPVRASRHDLTYRFGARAADGRVLGGWISVGTTPMSLRPDRIRVTLAEPDHEHA